MEFLRQVRSVRFAFGICLLLLVALVQSCSEIRYSLFGEKATARVIAVQPSSVDKNRDVRVDYRFEDAQGKPVRGKFSVSQSKWDRLGGDTLEVVYLGKDPEGTTQPVMMRSWFWPVLLLVFSLAVSGVAK
jgi:hypothetical protein